MSTQEIFDDTRDKMRARIESMRAEFNKVRTGRVHPGILDEVSVDYHGTQTPLSQMSTIKVESGRTLTVAPWDKGMLPSVEKAIVAANLGFNPSTQGDVIRIVAPPLTEERRTEYTRQVKQIAEQARVALRNIRRDANQALKDMNKNSEISQDEQQSGTARVQEITDDCIGQVDEVLRAKEEELMTL